MAPSDGRRIAESDSFACFAGAAPMMFVSYTLCSMPPPLQPISIA